MSSHWQSCILNYKWLHQRVYLVSVHPLLRTTFFRYGFELAYKNQILVSLEGWDGALFFSRFISVEKLWQVFYPDLNCAGGEMNDRLLLGLQIRFECVHIYVYIDVWEGASSVYSRDLMNWYVAYVNDYFGPSKPEALSKMEASKFYNLKFHIVNDYICICTRRLVTCIHSYPHVHTRAGEGLPWLPLRLS